jgi:hypothetical protein
MYLPELKKEPDLSSGNLLLSDHVFLARNSGILIFLDLHEDAYFQIENRFAEFVSTRLGLHLANCTLDFDSSYISEGEQLLGQLIANRILTEDIQRGDIP